MATIVILEHAMQDRLGLPYMIYGIADCWRARGHRVLVHRGTDNPPPGDVAVLNADVTVIPAAYLALAARYPRTINGAARDASKRRYSAGILGRGSDWNGPVMIKTENNFRGRPDRDLRMLCREAGVVCDIPPGPVMEKGYPILRAVRDVPESIWDTPGLMVQKFVPEQDERGYYLRTWIFLGDRERSSRWRASVPIINSRRYIDRETVPVPDEIRSWREKLGFDFGKFDYVRHDGQFVLLDANRTPAYPPPPPGRTAAPLDDIAGGLDFYLA